MEGYAALMDGIVRITPAAETDPRQPPRTPRWTIRRAGRVLSLVMLSLALAGIISFELDGPTAEPTTLPSLAAAPMATNALPAPATVPLPPITTYAEVTRRPLFSPTRQPVSPNVAQESLGDATSFILMGVVISEGGRTALIQHEHPVIMTRLREGETIEGWVVRSILPDRVALQHGATQEELKLKDLKD